MIYISRDNTVYGPYSESDAYEHFKSGQLLQTDLASTDGKSHWKPLLEVLLAKKGASEVPEPEEPSLSTQKDAPKKKRNLLIAGSVLLVITCAVSWLFIAQYRQKKAMEQFCEHSRVFLAAMEEKASIYEDYASTVEKLRTQMKVVDSENRVMLLVRLQELLRSPKSRVAAREDMARAETVEKGVTTLVTTQSKNHENLSYKLIKAAVAYKDVVMEVHQEPNNLLNYGKDLPEKISVYKGAIENLKLSLNRPQKMPGMFDFLTNHLPGQSKCAVARRFQSDLRQYSRCTLAMNDENNGIFGRGFLMECSFQFFPDGTMYRDVYTTIGDTSPVHTVDWGTYSIEGHTLTTHQEGIKSYTMEIKDSNDLLFEGQLLSLKRP